MSLTNSYRYISVSSQNVLPPAHISTYHVLMACVRAFLKVCLLMEFLSRGLATAAAEQNRPLQVSMQFRDGLTDLYAMIDQAPKDKLSTVKLSYASVLSNQKNETLTKWEVPFDQIWGTILSQGKLTVFGTFELPTETHPFIEFRSLLGVDVVHFADEIKPIVKDNLVFVNQIDVREMSVSSLLNAFDEVLRTLRDQFPVVFLQMDYRLHVSQRLAEAVIHDNANRRNSGYQAIMFDAIDNARLKTAPKNDGVLRVFLESNVWGIDQAIDRWDFFSASLSLKVLKKKYSEVDFSLQETYIANGLNNNVAPTRNFNSQHYPDMWCKIWRYELDQVLKSSKHGVLAIASGAGNARRLRDTAIRPWIPSVYKASFATFFGATSTVALPDRCDDSFQAFGTSFSYDPIQLKSHATFMSKLPEKIALIYAQYVSDVVNRGDHLSAKKIKELGDLRRLSLETQMDVIYHSLKKDRYPVSLAKMSEFFETVFTWDVSPFIGQRTFLRFEYALWKNMGFNDFEVAGVLYSANSVLAKELPFVRFVVEPRFESGMALVTYIYVANLPQSGQLYRAYFGKPLTESLDDLFFRQNELDILKYMYPFMGEGFRIPQVASREFWLARQESRIDELSEYEVGPSMFFRLPKDSPNINRTALDEWRVCAKEALTGGRNRVESALAKIKSEATWYGQFRRMFSSDTDEL